MAKITIRETDLTSNGINDVTTNAVYVPGYAVMGPINTPTLCRTLSEFVSIFGSKPYVFKNAQSYPVFTATVGGADVTPEGAMYESGAYEKSYTYAADLLAAGLPVYYERVFDDTKITSWRGTSTVNGVQAVEEGQSPNITITYTSGASSVEGVTIDHIRYIVKTNGQSGTTTFTYNETDGEWQNSDNTAIQLSDYGISIGEIVPEEGDKIVVSCAVSGVLTISATDEYVGAIGNNIKYSLDVTVEGSDTSSTRYKLTVYRVDSVGNKIDDTEESKQFVVEHVYDVDRAYVRYNELSDYFTLVNLTWTGTPDVICPVVAGTLTVSETVSGTGDEFTVHDMYKILSQSSESLDSTEDSSFVNPFDRLQNNGDYNIKFITSGAYPLFEATTSNSLNVSSAVLKQAKCAANRHDSTAIIDYANKITRTLTKTASVQNCFRSFVVTGNLGVNDLGEQVESYVTMFIPYGIYSSSSLGEEVIMPGSYGYLLALAASVQTNPNWLAVAGVKRGAVPNLKKLCQNVTNAIANSYQTQDEGQVSINPITNISPYGYVIWGNRTALRTVSQNALKASAFLNVRQLVNDLKKVVFVAARKLTFDPNSDILWINFKSEVEPTLTKMLTGQGVTKYKLTRVVTTKKATVVARIRIWPIEAVEDWDITIELADGTTTVTE